MTCRDREPVPACGPFCEVGEEDWGQDLRLARSSLQRHRGHVDSILCVLNVYTMCMGDHAKKSVREVSPQRCGETSSVVPEVCPKPAGALVLVFCSSPPLGRGSSPMEVRHHGKPRCSVGFLGQATSRFGVRLQQFLDLFWVDLPQIVEVTDSFDSGFLALLIRRKRIGRRSRPKTSLTRDHNAPISAVSGEVIAAPKYCWQIIWDFLPMCSSLQRECILGKSHQAVF